MLSFISASQSCTKVLRDGKTQFIPVGLRNVVTDDGCNYCSCVDVGIVRIANVLYVIARTEKNLL